MLAKTRDQRPPVGGLPIAVAVAALIVLLDVVGLPIRPVRVAAGLFLIAWAPGAAMLQLARPRFLAPSPRAVLAIPVSLSLAAVIGVVLDRTPVGIQPASMAVVDLVLTAVILAAAWWRHRGGPDADAGWPRAAAWPTTSASAISSRLRARTARTRPTPWPPSAADATAVVEALETPTAAMTTAGDAWAAGGETAPHVAAAPHADAAPHAETVPHVETAPDTETVPHAEPPADPTALPAWTMPDASDAAGTRPMPFARRAPRSRADASAIADALAGARARAEARTRAEARMRSAAKARAGAMSAGTAGARTRATAAAGIPASSQRAKPAIAGTRRLPVGAWTTAAIAHLRDPLFLNAYALGLSGVLTSGLGVVYWAVAARLYPADVVGVNASLLSLVTLLANVSQLNLRSGFGRFVPIAGAGVQRLVHAGYLAVTVLALLTGLGVVAILAVSPALLADVRLTPMLVWLFPLTVVLWAVFSLQDQVLIAFRRSAIVPLENGVFAFAKILLLVPLAGAATAYGILISWTLPTALGVAIVTGWVLVRLVPRARAAAVRPASARADAVETGAILAPRAEPVTAGSILRYVAGDYVGSLFAIGSSSILPVLVLGVLGAAPSAHFYMVGMIATATQLVPTVLATSLLVEVSSGRATFDGDGVRVTRQLALLLAPITLVLVVFADPILGIFGANYAADGATALRLLALAGIPYSVINLAFIRLRLEQRVRWVVAAQAMLAVLLIVPVLIVLPTWGITGVGVVTLVSETAVGLALGWSELRTVLAAAAGLRIGRREA